MKNFRRRRPARKLMKLSDGTGCGWRSWLKRAGVHWIHTAGADGWKLAERRVSRDEAREFIERHAGRVWVAFYPMFGQLTVELI